MKLEKKKISYKQWLFDVACKSLVMDGVGWINQELPSLKLSLNYGCTGWRGT